MSIHQRIAGLVAVLAVALPVPVGAEGSGDPDLVVGIVGVAPSTPFEDEVASAEVVVANFGGGSAPATTLRILLDGAPLADVAVPALASHAAARFDVPVQAALGPHVLAAVADADDAAAESSETNNTHERAFQVVRPADLAVTELTLTPIRQETGEFAARATACNEGDVPAPHATLSYYVGESPGSLPARYVAHATWPSLAPGACETFEWQGRVPVVGRFAITAHLWSGARERDVADNQRSATSYATADVPFTVFLP